MILDSIRAYAAEHVDSSKFDHDGKFPDGVRQGLHELGVMGLSIPEGARRVRGVGQSLQSRLC
jgi:alkylation response protein AidB-like acyl-CoA dehydrogenase